MKRFILLLAFQALFYVPDFDSAVLLLSGASAMEELDESTLEHFRSLAANPVNLNTAGRSRLLATGLFNPFQIASLMDYRARTGDILSYTELGLLDGFTPEYADALEQFTSLRSDGPPGARHGTRFHNDLMLRASARRKDGLAAAGGVRYKASLGDKAELNWASRTTYDEQRPGLGTISAAYYGRGVLGKLILGHYNARFGQGLALWSAFSMSHYGSVSSFMRNAGGLSATGSFSPSYCGAAADFELGRWNIAAAYSFSNKVPIAAVSYCGRVFTAGISASDKTVSLDWKLGFRNTCLFGETAWNDGPAAVAGVVRVPKYGCKYGLRLSYVKEVPEAAAGVSTGGFDAVAAFSSKQFRLMLKYAPAFKSGLLELGPSLRLAARNNDGWRLEGRAEVKSKILGWNLNSRIDLVHCGALSWLANLEAGYSVEKLSLWLRGTLFCIDEWDGRIYVYERDAPGNFNVPAYYGRGRSFSFTAAWKPSPRHSFYLRISHVEYPWMTVEKSSKSEVKLQYNLKL